MNLKPYPKYKDSGIEWLGEIPEGWEIEKLRFIGRFTASGIDKKIVEGEPLVKIINYTDIYGNTIQTLKSDNNYMEVSCPEEKRRQHQVRKGDLIFTPSSETIEDIGLSAVVDEELENTAYSYHVLRFRFEKEVDHNFKKYLCNNDFVLNQFSSNAKGTTRQILNRENFNSTVVILPPVDEQTAIATLLDQKTAKIDELIRKNETLVELLKEKRQAIISHAVTKGIPHHPPLEKGGWGDLKMKDSGIEWLGEIQQGWEVKRLKYVANVNPQALTENTNIGYELKYVDISNVGEEGLLNEPVTMSFRDAPSRARRIIRKNDVIISTVRTYLKAIAYLSNPESNFIVSTGFAVLRATKTILPKFLYYFIRSNFFVDSIMANSVGVNYPAINSSVLAGLTVLLPCKNEQTTIADYLDIEIKKIDKTIQKINSQIQKLKEYRQALISNVVTGKVRVL